MLSHLAALVAVASISSVYAGYLCDSTSQPDYDSCDTIMGSVNWDTGNGGQMIEWNKCVVFWDEKEDGSVGNCEIAACNGFPDKETRNLNGWAVQAAYNVVTRFCKPDKAGGQYPGSNDGAISIFKNNANYKPASRLKRSLKSHVGSAYITSAEYEARRQRASNINEVPTEGNSLEKREDKWTNWSTSLGVTRGNRDRLSAITGSGASSTWTTTKGFSTSVTTSVEIGASFFEVFSASMSVSVTFEESVSYAESLTFDPSGKCDKDQSAILYMYPLYDEYVGFRNDDTSNFIEILVPQKGNSNYKIEVECLG